MVIRADFLHTSFGYSESVNRMCVAFVLHHSLYHLMIFAQLYVGNIFIRLFLLYFKKKTAMQ